MKVTNLVIPPFKTSPKSNASTPTPEKTDCCNFLDQMTKRVQALTFKLSPDSLPPQVDPFKKTDCCNFLAQMIKRVDTLTSKLSPEPLPSQVELEKNNHQS